MSPTSIRKCFDHKRGPDPFVARRRRLDLCLQRAISLFLVVPPLPFMISFLFIVEPESLPHNGPVRAVCGLRIARSSRSSSLGPFFLLPRRNEDGGERKIDLAPPREIVFLAPPCEIVFLAHRYEPRTMPVFLASNLHPATFPFDALVTGVRIAIVGSMDRCGRSDYSRTASQILFCWFGVAPFLNQKICSCGA